MGIQNLHQQLQKWEIPPEYHTFEAYARKVCPATICVDMGFYWCKMRNLLFHDNIAAMATLIHGHFQGIANVTLVFDGSRSSTQKSNTAAKRFQLAEGKLLELQKLAATVTRAGKVQRAKWQKAKKLCKACFRPTSEQINLLMAALVELEMSVVRAKAEADVWIAEALGTNPLNIALSVDGDLLAHLSVNNWIVPKVTKGTLVVKVYRKTSILEKLRLTPAGFTALCAVSGNDYDKNLKGYGLGRNLTIIRRLGDKGHVQNFVRAYVDEFKFPEGTDTQRYFIDLLSYLTRLVSLQIALAFSHFKPRP